MCDVAQQLLNKPHGACLRVRVSLRMKFKESKEKYMYHLSTKKQDKFKQMQPHELRM
jgi:hypothetical protein